MVLRPSTTLVHLCKALHTWWMAIPMLHSRPSGSLEQRLLVGSPSTSLIMVAMVDSVLEELVVREATHPAVLSILAQLLQATLRHQATLLLLLV